MKGKIMLIGLAIVIVVLIGLAASGAFTSPYFETENSMGLWGQDIKVLYEDGTSESLAMLMNKPLSTLSYNSKSIIGFDYNLNAKLTGTGYTDTTVTLSNYALTITAVGTQGSMPKTVSYSYPLISGANSVPLDGSFHNIGGVATFPAKTKFDTAGFSSGSIYIKFTPSGTVTFKGNPDGTTQTGAMPSPITLTVGYFAGGSLSLDLSSNIPSYP